ncbi:MAG: prepilin-type N-terminal cleavage/methylation domain-containing protein [Myxococcota bacterium]
MQRRHRPPSMARLGFTLIEVMIVVAIIGILAAIAVPRFVDYQLQSKTTEAFIILGKAKIAQETYRSQFDCYAATIPNPPGALTPGRRPWDDTNVPVPNPCQPGDRNFETIGVSVVDRQLYYQYACEAINPAGGVPPDYTCAARGDLDGDSNEAEFINCTDNLNTGACPAASHYGTVSAFPFETIRLSVALY